MKKRIIAFVLLVTMIISLVPVVSFAADELTLPAEYKEYFPDISTRTPFRPVHQYLYRQNPPVFLWPAISNAESYDVIVCTDPELTEIKYEKRAVKDNFVFFDTTFEENVYYWWAMRYNKDGKSSEWSVARRFKMASDSVELVFPTKEKILESIPKAHPRFFFTTETLPKVKEDIMSSPTAKKYMEEKLVREVNKDITNGVLQEPEMKDYQALKDTGSSATSSGYSGAGRAAAQNMGNALMRAALLYNLTGDTKAADYAVECLVQFADWEWKDPNAPTSFEVNDLGYYEVITYGAIGYDWMYNYMTQEQRDKVAEMIYGRVDARYRKMMNGVRQNPYESHSWSYSSYFGIGIMALLHDIPNALNMYDEWFGVYISNFNPLSIEDGAYGKGINYWLSAFARDSIFHDAMSYSGIFDYYKIPFYQKQHLYGIYNFPEGSNINSWGDGGNVGTAIYPYIATGASRTAKLANKPEMLWWRNRHVDSYYNYQSPFSFDAIFFLDTDDMEERVPIDYPRDHCFIDQGLTSMHSDLINTPRTSFYFRSGMYGSYNHTQADINSFMIERNGEELAWKGGYYDTYGSSHWTNFSKTTPAHNTITVDNGVGQPIHNFDADGRIKFFLSHTDMSAATGDGTDAYMGNLGKYDRTIVYIRPDSYIVIDNLAASDVKKANNGSTFEWWINSVGTLDVHDDKRGVKITNGPVALDARVHYPEKVTPYYSNLFSSTDLVDWPTDDRKTGAAYHSRVWFQTEKVDETKMVVTMDSRDIGDSAEVVKTKKYDNYIEFEFEDGTMAYVSLATDETTMIDTGEYKFNGTAVVHNDDALMFIGGTELYIRGQQVVNADRPVAVSMGKDELSVSSDDDYNVTVYPNELYMPNPETIIFRDGRETEMGLGCEAVIDTETKAVNVKADKGHYYMYLNGKVLPGEKTGETWNYTLVVDDKEKTYSFDNIIYNADYESEGIDPVVNENIIFDTEYYVVDATDNIYISGMKAIPGQKVLIKSGSEVRVVGNNEKAVLRSIPAIQAEIEYTDDSETVLKNATVIIEAEHATGFTGNARFTNGIATMGVSQLNTMNDKAYYTVNIPESGNYKFAIRYAAWQDPYPTRFMEMDGIRYYFKLPDSGGYGANTTDFDFVTVQNELYLEAGEHKFEIGANGVGAWNYDCMTFTKVN